MPYIDETRGQALREDPYQLETKEELAFLFCDLADQYIANAEDGRIHAGRIIDVFGVLVETILEVQERVGRPHEERARERPGAAEPFAWAKNVLRHYPR